MEIKPAYQGNGKYIFVSYAHKDRDLVYPFIALLQEKYNVWYDEGIKYGSEWTEDIINKLHNCSLFLFLITKNSMESENCKDEIHSAREEGKNFINIIFDKDLTLPREFVFRYGRFQMCYVYKFKSLNDVIRDLESKCEWFNDVILNEDEQVVTTPVIKEETIKVEKIETKIGDVIKFGRYQQGNGIEEIEWLVIDKDEDEKTLTLISKYILFACLNHDWFSKESWSFLINYLDKDFIKQAFNEKERAQIVPFALPVKRGVGKTFKVNSVLPSVREIEYYFPDKKSRAAKPTLYAKNDGVKTKLLSEYGAYWTRTSGNKRNEYAAVSASGDIIYKDESTMLGGRPMLKIIYN